MTELAPLLQTLIERGGSDLHLRVGEPPVLRIDTRLERTAGPPLTAEDTRQIAAELLTEEQRKAFAERLDLEFVHATEDARFRVNIFRQQGQVGAILRHIPVPVRSIEDLLLPPILKGLALQPRGLLLVAGPTGSGKSTTLAALIDYINANSAAHIISIEDPIEAVHTDKKGAVDQRQVGPDTRSIADALRHVLRQNPDVISISDMPDLETVSLALTAAETGRLVLASVPANEASRAIEHVIELFPIDGQRQIRTQLAATLLAVVSQTLLPRADPPGRVAAFEVMVVTPSIRHSIRDAKTHQITADIQTGGQHGMESLEASLMELVRKKMVRYEDALMKSLNPREFEQRAAALNPARR